MSIMTSNVSNMTLKPPSVSGSLDIIESDFWEGMFNWW